MKKSLLIALVLLLAFGAVGLRIWIMGEKPLQTQVQPPVQFPASSGTSTAVLAGQNSFLSSPEVHQDPDNPGYYYVGYQPTDASAPYLIRYIAETHNFTISLNREPIGENRNTAERYLMQLLGTTKEQMCAFDYAVYVSNEVNSQYSGENLGFSFCPGAVQLPE